MISFSTGANSETRGQSGSSMRYRETLVVRQGLRAIWFDTSSKPVRLRRPEVAAEGNVAILMRQGRPSHLDE